MVAQGLLDVIEKSSQLDKTENTEPGIWCIRFYFVSSRSEADWVEGVLFDVLEGWHVVPASEFFTFLRGVLTVLATGWNPVATEDTLLVSVDVTGAGDSTFGSVLVVDIGWVLCPTFVLGERFVANDLGDFVLLR